MATTGGKRGNVKIADPEIQTQPTRLSAQEKDDYDDVSISSHSSSSSSNTSISKQFVEDSTSATGVSTSKRSMSTTERTGGNWLDDNMNASRSSTLVLGLVLLSSVILAAVLFSVSTQQDNDAFQNKVLSHGRIGNHSGLSRCSD